MQARETNAERRARLDRPRLRRARAVAEAHARGASDLELRMVALEAGKVDLAVAIAAADEPEIRGARRWVERNERAVAEARQRAKLAAQSAEAKQRQRSRQRGPELLVPRPRARRRRSSCRRSRSARASDDSGPGDGPGPREGGTW